MDDHLRIGNNVKFQFKDRLLEGTVMDFEEDYEGYSNLNSKVRICGIMIDKGEMRQVNVWREQEEVEYIPRRLYV